MIAVDSRCWVLFNFTRFDERVFDVDMKFMLKSDKRAQLISEWLGKILKKSHAERV